MKPHQLQEDDNLYKHKKNRLKVEPLICSYCEGLGRHRLSPCCALEFVTVDTGFQCPSCNLVFVTLTCEECAGEGAIYEN